MMVLMRDECGTFTLDGVTQFIAFADDEYTVFFDDGNSAIYKGQIVAVVKED